MSKKNKSIVKLNDNDIDAQINSNISIYEEYFDITVEVDRYINNILHQIRKLEKTCLDKKILKYFAKMQYNYNQITAWRNDSERDKEYIAESLAWWYVDSVKQIKRLVKRLNKFIQYKEIYINSLDHLDNIKIIIRNPRYAYIDLA